MSTAALIREGDVLEIAEKGRFFLATVLANEAKAGRYRVLLESGRSSIIAQKQINHILKLRLDPSWPESMLISEMHALSLRALEQSKTCDIAMLWELLKDDENTAIHVDDAAEFFFSKLEALQQLSAIRALREDKIYFKALNPAEYIPRPQSTVEECITQQRIIEEREAFAQEFADLAEAIFAQDPERRTEALAAVLEDRAARDAWALIEDYALYGVDESKHKDEAERLLGTLQKRQELNFQGTAHYRARAFLRESGYWGADSNIALKKYRIPIEFSAEIDEETEALLESTLDFERRRDLSNLRCFSIDDPDTMEIDDALSIRRIDDAKLELGVHIASPASIIPFDSAIERAARRRASSIYIPQGVITMLPERISYDKASLCCGVQRHALSFLFVFDDGWQCLDVEIVPSIIRVSHRLSYEEVEELLEFSSTSLAEELRIIHEITESLQQNRIAQGAIDIDAPESKISIDPQSQRIKLQPIDNNMMSRNLVSECMLLANTAAAKFSAKHHLRVLYRAQAQPINFPSQAELDALPNNTLRSIAMRRSMMPAVSTHSPDAHAGLGVDAYLQISSPLRRYADLFAQYQIEQQILENTPITDEEYATNILSASEAALGDAKAAMSESRRDALLLYLKQESDKTIAATLIAYTSNNAQIAQVVLDETQLRASVSTRKRYPIGSSLTLQIDQIKPDEQYFTLKVLE
ncbi:MAG: ribonuclease catalytic domain-containing protein [Bradymonadia bacterium]|jgi:exoribonuclease-2